MFRYSSVALKFFNDLSARLDRVVSGVDSYIRQNGQLIFFLGIVALAAYGFELFNFNLTIDEELHAFFTGPTTLWLGEGRWGMYLLNRFLLPYTVIPVIPLLLALIFHIAAILLILDCWEVNSRLERMVSGALMLTFPTLAYIYMFSTVNFGVGIGFFCAALSLLLYKKNSGIGRWWAVLPAAFAISIYQAFALVLAGVFLVHLIIEVRKGNSLWKDAVHIGLILAAGFVAYYLVQKLCLSFFLALLSAAEKNAFIERNIYTQSYLNFTALRENTFEIVSRTWDALIQYYLGRHSTYVIKVTALAWVMVASLIGFLLNLRDDRITILNKMIMFTLLIGFLVLPFAGALFVNGYVVTRTLLALPVVIGGFFILGLPKDLRLLRICILALGLFCVFQFSVSTNRLFGSSHLALQADRAVAVRLMEKIDEAKAAAGIQNPTYLEVVGVLKRGGSQAAPNRTTVGLSIFEFVQGDQPRIASFLEILGYPALKALPASKITTEFVWITQEMPDWPAEGSVKIVGDIVLVKFGEYSQERKGVICAQSLNTDLPEGFCQ